MPLKNTCLNNKEKELLRFWKSFYDELRNSYFVTSKNSLTKSEHYKELVFEKLENGKRGQGCEELRKLQLEIEDLTMEFDEESIFKSVPNLIKILIKTNDINAKDFLRSKIDSEEVKELLSELGQYTIEALIIHVLSMVFNTLEVSSIIRVATLIERLESSVRSQALLLKQRRRCKNELKLSMDNQVNDSDKDKVDVNQVNVSDKDKEKKRKRKKHETMYPIGSRLVDFMVERGLISLTNEAMESISVKTRNKSYYIPKHICVYCNFDLSLLPIKLNLPMVYPPLDWTSACPDGKNPRYLSDLSGGYLSGPTGDIYDRYRLLSSGDINHFYIDISQNHEKLCNVMNKLQCQPFEINSIWLNYIFINEDKLVEHGYLMPRFLASIRINDVSKFLREYHMKDAAIKEYSSFSELLHTLCKDIQRSRYEQLILKLAKAYEGYQFYLPAFLDFRGRIYRCGILHFHERDLARSMILFGGGITSNNNVSETSLIATAFHYKSFNSFMDAGNWFVENLSLMERDLIEFAQDAKHPFQFLSNMIVMSHDPSNQIHMKLPITQDASASAYQIMSYLLLDETLAMSTNMFPSQDNKIKDVYEILLYELKEFILKEWEDVNPNLSLLVSNLLTRKIVKGIFMPIIYGKTIKSTCCDLKESFSHYITHKECFEIASLCFKFWKTKYHGMDCLIRLIRNIGWIASARGSPVFYKVPYFKTVQDYMKMEPIYIWVYNKHHKKRHRVTLRVSSSERNRRKTEISTFVNFIHQRDASIAMKVVESMLDLNAPIYTVHDNFITSSEYSDLIPKHYSSTFSNMGPPLSIINEFIYMNVIEPTEKMCGNIQTNCKGIYADKVIPINDLEIYLKKNIPAGKMSKKMMDTWNERILGTLSAYENYIRNVCGEHDDSWKAHDLKWIKFKFQLENDNLNNYIVHY